MISRDADKICSGLCVSASFYVVSYAIASSSFYSALRFFFEGGGSIWSHRVRRIPKSQVESVESVAESVRVIKLCVYVRVCVWASGQLRTPPISTCIVPLVVIPSFFSPFFFIIPIICVRLAFSLFVLYGRMRNLDLSDKSFSTSCKLAAGRSDPTIVGRLNFWTVGRWKTTILNPSVFIGYWSEGVGRLSLWELVSKENDTKRRRGAFVFVCLLPSARG